MPLERIVVNKSVVRWYHLGGLWINMGLPQYVAIDRKPDNRCKIQNAACKQSRVMLELKLVKTVDKIANKQNNSNKADHLHGTQVLKHLVSPWCELFELTCTLQLLGLHWG